MDDHRLLELNQKTITGPAYLTKIMPAPVIEEATEYIPAGPVTIGVEYRYLRTADPEDGVCLHVFADSPQGRTEYLRFDCFEEGPHYHYMTWAEHRQVVFPMDRVTNGDPLEWALACLRERLAPMLAFAGAQELAQEIEARPGEVAAAMPRVIDAANRAIEQVREQQGAAASRAS